MTAGGQKGLPVCSKHPDPAWAQSLLHMFPLVFSDLKSPSYAVQVRQKGWIWEEEWGLVFGQCCAYKRKFITVADQCLDR